MNLLEFYKQNKDNLEVFKDHGIRYKIKDNLILFDYGIGFTTFSEPWENECRGSIIDMDTDEFVCRPFDKFWNYNEPHSDAKYLDMKTAIASQKHDGSLIKIWFYDGCWRISSSSTIDIAELDMLSNDFPLSKYGFNNAKELVLHTMDFSLFDFTAEDREYTHMFELCTFLNVILIKHTDSKLIYLTSRHNKTGEYKEIKHIRFKHKTDYFKIDGNTTLEEMAEDANKMGKDFTFEGWVVSSPDMKYRVKIKADAYVKYQKTIFQAAKSPKMLFNLIRSGDHTEIIAYFPSCVKYFEPIINNISLIRDYFTNGIATCLLRVKDVENKSERMTILKNSVYGDSVTKIVQRLMSGTADIEYNSVDRIMADMDYSKYNAYIEEIQLHYNYSVLVHNSGIREQLTNLMDWQNRMIAECGVQFCLDNGFLVVESDKLLKENQLEVLNVTY